MTERIYIERYKRISSFFKNYLIGKKKRYIEGRHPCLLVVLINKYVILTHLTWNLVNVFEGVNPESKSPPHIFNIQNYSGFRELLLKYTNIR